MGMYGPLLRQDAQGSNANTRTSSYVPQSQSQPRPKLLSESGGNTSSQTGGYATNAEGMVIPQTAHMVGTVHAPASTYQEIFGGPPPSETIAAKQQYYSLTGEDFSHEPEWIRRELEASVVDYSSSVSAEETKKITEFHENFESGDATVYDLYEDKDLVETYEEARNDVSPEAVAKKINKGDEYTTPTSLQEAKGLADRVYIDTLQHHLATKEVGSKEYNQIQEAINRGAPDFSNPSLDYQQLGLGFTNSNYNPSVTEAARFQAATVKDYLVSNNIPLYQETDNERIEGGRVYLNTGTALQMFEEDAPSGSISQGYGYHASGGDLGSYSNYELTPPPRESSNPLKKVLNVASAVLSVMYPQFAPIFQGTNTLVQGGDLEDALKSAGTAYVGGKVGELANSEIIEGFDKLGVDITTLPQSAQNIILDTSKAVLQGDSGTDEFIKSTTGEMLDSIDIDIDAPDFDFNTPQFIKDFGDEIYAGIKAVGDVAEEGINLAEDALRPVGDFAEEVIDLTADAFEPVVDFVDEGLDYFGETVVDPTLQRGSDVLSNVEDVVKEGGRAVDKYGLQPIKEFGEDAINKVKELADSLPEFETPQFSSLDIELPEMPDIDLPDIDLPDIDLPDIDLNMPSSSSTASQASRPSATEELFSKELFKYNTEVKFTGGMLSPDTNLRKYG